MIQRSGLHRYYVGEGLSTKLYHEDAEYTTLGGDGGAAQGTKIHPDLVRVIAGFLLSKPYPRRSLA